LASAEQGDTAGLWNGRYRILDNEGIVVYESFATPLDEKSKGARACPCRGPSMDRCDTANLSGPPLIREDPMQNLNLKLLAVVFFLLPFPFLSGCAVVAATGAAAGTGLAISEDRRTSGTMVQDESIEFKSNRRIKEKFSRKVHVEVTSFNRHVLLTGETASAAVKNEIEDIVRAVEGVRDVTNKIAVGEVRPLTARSHDAWITSKVKGRFVNEGLFQANHVKVVTENGVVYLMGLVDREEAQSAVKIAKATDGVRDIMQVFEYLD
jgi:osmotically-inducible protein OsmY